MRDQQPPRVATWLAQRLMSGPRRESLLGDLIEQYRQGRSGIWYWRQVLGAILVGTVHDLAAHKMLALRTLTIGWTLYYLFSFPVTWAGSIAEDWLSDHVILCAPDSFWCQFWRNQFSVELLIYVAAAVSGGIVARCTASIGSRCCLYLPRRCCSSSAEWLVGSSIRAARPYPSRALR